MVEKHHVVNPKPFSGFRCLWNPAKAEDPKISRGYLHVEVDILRLIVSFEKFFCRHIPTIGHKPMHHSRQMFGEDNWSSNNVCNTARFSINRRQAPTPSTLISLAQLLPPFHILVNVNGDRVVYRSPPVSFKDDVLYDLKRQFKTQDLKKQKRYTPMLRQRCDHSLSSKKIHGKQRTELSLDTTPRYRYTRQFYSTSIPSFHEGCQGTFNGVSPSDHHNEEWLASFDIYKPGSTLDFVLASSGDNAIKDIYNVQVLSNLSIPVDPDLMKLSSSPFQDHTLIFTLAIPSSSLSCEMCRTRRYHNKQRKLHEKTQRHVKIYLNIRLKCTFASRLWKLWLLCTVFRPDVPKPAMDIEQRVCFAISHDKSMFTNGTLNRCEKHNINVMINRVSLMIILLHFWATQIHQFWNTHTQGECCIKTLAVYVLVSFMLLPRLTMGFLLLYLGIGLLTGAYTAPWFSKDPLSEDLNVLKTVGFRTDDNEVYPNKQYQKKYSNSLLKSFIDAAGSKEVDLLFSCVMYFVNTFFPLLIRLHGYLTGHTVQDIGDLYLASLNNESEPSYFTLDWSVCDPYIVSLLSDGSKIRYKLDTSNEKDDAFLLHTRFLFTYFTVTFSLLFLSCVAFIKPTLLIRLLSFSTVLLWTYTLVRNVLPSLDHKAMMSRTFGRCLLPILSVFFKQFYVTHRNTH